MLLADAIDACWLADTLLTPEVVFSCGHVVMQLQYIGTFHGGLQAQTQLDLEACHVCVHSILLHCKRDAAQ